MSASLQTGAEGGGALGDEGGCVEQVWQHNWATSVTVEQKEDASGQLLIPETSSAMASATTPASSSMQAGVASGVASGVGVGSCGNGGDGDGGGGDGSGNGGDGNGGGGDGAGGWGLAVGVGSGVGVAVAPGAGAEGGEELGDDGGCVAGAAEQVWQHRLAMVSSAQLAATTGSEQPVTVCPLVASI